MSCKGCLYLAEQIDPKQADHWCAKQGTYVNPAEGCALYKPRKEKK